MSELSKAVLPAGVPRPPAALAAFRAVFRYSPTVAQPSFQNVRRKPPSETLSPNHWCMFSWWNTPADGVEAAPFANVILVCISSSKPAFGRPTMTPSVVNGQGPLNCDWKFVMSSWVSRTALIVALRAAVRPLACAW